MEVPFARWHFLRRPFPRSGLRTHLAFSFGSLAILVALLASLVIGYTDGQQVQSSIGRNLANLAFQTTDKLDRGMFERYRDMLILTALPPFQNGSVPLDEKRILLEQLQATYPDYAWIGFMDPQGTVLASTQGMLEGADVSARPWFEGALGGPFVGDVHEALLLAQLLPNPSNEPLRFVDVAAPVLDAQGQVQSVVGAHLSWSWAKEVQQSLLSSQDVQNGIEVFILDQQNLVILDPSTQTEQTQPLTLDGFTGTGEPNYRLMRWPDGVTYLTGFAQSQGYRNYPGLGWQVLVRQRADIALAPVYELQRRVLALGTLAGVLCAALGWFIAGYITAPLRSITSAAARIQRGEHAATLPLVRGYSEAAILSETLQSLITDLTARTEEINRLNAQLEQRIATRTAQLEAANRELETFSYSVSHDLRAPLRSISGFAQALNEDCADRLDATGQDYLCRIQSSARRMSNLIEDLLQLAHVNRSTIERRPVSLSLLATAILTELQRQEPQRNVQMVIVPDLLVCGDEGLLMIALENLLSNAWKFTGKQATACIEIGYYVEEHERVCFVRDNGAGFDMTYASRLFGPFQRLHRTDEFPGTGVGLATVQRIIHRHDGRIWAESAIGAGTTFYFTLPE